MRLPVPFRVPGGKVVNEAELMRPKGGTLADAKRVADTGDIYSAVLTFVAGTIVSLSGEGFSISGTAEIKQACRSMPYVDSDYLALNALILAGVDDLIDTFCTCPRCRKTLPETDEMRIKDLVLEESLIEPKTQVTLAYPVELVDRKSGEVFEKIEELGIRYPCLEDCVIAFRSVGVQDPVRFQYRVYLEAIETVNGTAVDRKWKQEIGAILFDKMDISDIRAITTGVTEYGLKQVIRRTCPFCGKEFDFGVSTSDFFVSGLGGNA